MFEANESDVLTVKPYDRFILLKQNLGFIKRLDSQKNEVKSLLFFYIGKSRTDRKPSPLRRLEKGMKKYFFGDNGIITKQIPQLRNEYKKEKNRILFVGQKSELMQNFSENNIFIKKNNKSSKTIKKN